MVVVFCSPLVIGLVEEHNVDSIPLVHHACDLVPSHDRTERGKPAIPI